MSKQKKTHKSRNPMALAVRQMGHKVVKDKTRYTRKDKHKKSYV